MDTLSHGFWAGAAYKAVNNKTDKKLSVGWAAFWGVFPDLFAFTIPITMILLGMLNGTMSSADLPDPTGIEPPMARQMLWPVQLASMLYNYSHSLVIFSLIFGLVYLLKKRPVWELGGWLLHILIDIPTHTYLFYPTPLFWPLSSWKFDGFSWGTPWFMIVNYSLLLLTYFLLRKKRGGVRNKTPLSGVGHSKTI
jgi:hypothetical protein